MLKKKISSALAIGLCLLAVLFSFAPSTRAAQAKQSEEAAAIEAFITFVNYMQKQDTRAWNYISAQTQDWLLETRLKLLEAEPYFQKWMQQKGISRNELINYIKTEMATPESEIAKECWAVICRYFPQNETIDIELKAVINGDIAVISEPKDNTDDFVTMKKEKGQWKFDVFGMLED